MGRYKLTHDERIRLDSLFGEAVPSIIEAELNTIKETAQSEHVARCYMFTTYSMSMCEIFIDGLGPGFAIKRAISAMRSKEGDGFPEEYADLYDPSKSWLAGLLVFMPATIVKSKDKEFLDGLVKGEISTDEFIKGAEHETKRESVYQVVIMHYVDYGNDKTSIYELIVHNDEVLDIRNAAPELNKYVHYTLNEELKKLIEVE